MWEMAKEPGGRLRFRIVSIEAGLATIVFERSQRFGTQLVANLAKGLRASRCITLADGSPAPPPPKYVPRSKRELASHPDHVDDDGPVFALLPRSPSDDAVEEAINKSASDFAKARWLKAPTVRFTVPGRR